MAQESSFGRIEFHGIGKWDAIMQQLVKMKRPLDSISKIENKKVNVRTDSIRYKNGCGIYRNELGSHSARSDAQGGCKDLRGYESAVEFQSHSAIN